MRILFLTGEYPPDPSSGGIGAHVAATAAALAKARHEVHVLVCAPGLAIRDDYGSRVRVHHRPFRPAVRWLRGRTGGRVALAWSHLAHTRSLGRFDVIEAPDWQAQGLGIGLGHPAPLVVCLHTPDVVIARQRGDVVARLRLSDRLEALATRLAEVVTAPAHLLIDELRTARWLNASTSVVVALPPIDLGLAIEGADAADTGAVIAAVGRLERRKGFDTLLRAAAMLRDEIPDMRVALIGADTVDEHGTSWAATLRDLASELGVTLTIDQPRAHDEMADWYAAARVVAVPSHFESFSMAGLEALAAGRALVCTDRVGVGELADGSDALTVTADDASALAAGLRPLLVDADRAGRAGRAARALAFARCHPDHAVAERVALYERAIALSKMRIWRVS